MTTITAADPTNLAAVETEIQRRFNPGRIVCRWTGESTVTAWTVVGGVTEFWREFQVEAAC